MPVSWRYLARRLLLAIPTLLAVTVLSYVIAVSAGNHFWVVINSLAKLGIVITPQQVLQLEQYYHVGQPAFEGYFLWLSDLLRGNLGTSINGTPVLDVIGPRLLPTVMLQVPAIMTSAVIGLFIGVYSAGRHNSLVDRIVTSVSSMVLAVPAFWLATFSILFFSLQLRLLPSFGNISPYPPYWWGSPFMDQVAHYILPFSILVLVSTPIYARLARANAIDVLSSDWVTAMRTSSIGRSRLLYRHVLRNAIGPALAAFSVNFAVFLAASPGIEVAFNWPGLGLSFVKAALDYDQPVMMGIVLLMTLITITVTLVTDVAQTIVDPRVSFQ